MRPKTRVLVVDDSPTQVEVLRRILEERGFDASVATSGEDALDALRREPFDLVLSDVVMPGISGYELCRKIKSEGEIVPPPAVVLLTSLADPVDIVRGLESQADNYVTKPYDADRLVERIEEVLTNHKMRGDQSGVTRRPVTLQFLGRSFEITADRHQILQLLLSSYDELVKTNSALAESRVELGEAHQRELAVEQRVREEIERSAERLQLIARGSALFSKAESSREVAETLTGLVEPSTAWSAVVLFVDDGEGSCVLESVVPSRSKTGSVQSLGPDPCAFLRALAATSGARHLDEAERAEVRALLSGAGGADGVVGEGPTMAVPLRWRRRALGVMLVGQREGHAFDDSDTPVLENLSGRAAVAIDRHRLVVQEKQALTAAEEAIKLRDDVMATVSHDLRNTVGVAYSAASLLLDIPLPEHSKTEQLKLIRRAADQANRLIEDLFVVATQESGTFNVVPRPVTVSALLEEAETLMAPIANEANVRLVVDQPENDTDLKADPDRIFRVFSNLIGNAIKYSPAGESVHLSVKIDRDAVAFFVRDHGPGISKDVLPRVFDRFYQVEGEQGAGGAGLGLAIAHAIVTAHGGTIGVDSEIGAGTTFRFTLPRDGSSGAAEA